MDATEKTRKTDATVVTAGDARFAWGTLLLKAIAEDGRGPLDAPRRKW